MNRPLRVLALTENEGFCFFYRIKWPMMALHELGLIELVVMKPSFNTPDSIGEHASMADVIIFHYAQPDTLLMKYSKLIKKHWIKQILVSEFDDDYTSLSPLNHAYKYFGQENVITLNGKELWIDGKIFDSNDSNEPVFNIQENKDRLWKMQDACCESDLITTTNKILLDTFHFSESKKQVLGNYIYPIPEIMPMGTMPDNDFITIGWQGGDSHYEDLYSCMPTLEKIKEKYGDKVKFKFFGAKFPGLYKRIDGDFIPWIKPIDFYKKFSENLFDIGIIPLVDNKFNRSKSNIKWLEYSYYGIPSVVANVIPYSLDGTHDVNLLYYNSPGQMFKNLCTLIDSKEERKRISINAKAYVVENYDIRKHCLKWYDAYIDCLSKK
ncbi:hypothetical protein UFOVP1009_16 [uncultured Caudovirales phage]|uniref:Glycosyl transferases group 1 n=1 Tax=uncultured Caudovirales phage TaxID=2100421 RepID=A0A6J5Q5V2_9CAUD|nr:hypothetical protein UFOVP1009_16 [uncultured Caudovirales phage]